MERRELESLTVLALKRRLREAGLKVSGRKAELIERLLEHRFGAGKAMPDLTLPFEVQPDLMLDAFVRKGVAARVAVAIATDMCAIVTVAAQVALDHAGAPKTTARVLPAYAVDTATEHKEADEDNLGRTLDELAGLSLVFVPIRAAYTRPDGRRGGHAFLCIVQPKAKTFMVFDSQIDAAADLHAGVLGAFRRAGYRQLLPVCLRRVQYDRLFCAVFTVLASVVLAANPVLFDVEFLTRDHIIEDRLREPRIFLSALRWVAELKAPETCVSSGLHWGKDTPFLMLADQTARIPSLTDGIAARTEALVEMLGSIVKRK